MPNRSKISISKHPASLLLIVNKSRNLQEKKIGRRCGEMLSNWDQWEISPGLGFLVMCMSIKTVVSRIASCGIHFTVSSEKASNVM